jgi:hypothetical protein
MLPDVTISKAYRKDPTKNNVKKNCMIRPKNFTNNFLAESSHKFKARGQKKIFLFLLAESLKFSTGRIIKFFQQVE